MLYLADNIKYLRAHSGQSQQELAHTLGITRSRYSKYEYGMAEPPLEILVKISAYFGVTLDAIATTDIRQFKRP